MACWKLSAYVARPQGEPLGAIVVIQEIFGVNKSIQAVADSYAKDGFLAVAPAIMDRIERNLNLGYGEADLKKAFGLYPSLNPDDSLKDVAAAFNYAKGICPTRSASPRLLLRRPRQLALRNSAELDLAFEPACTVCYYPGGIGKFAAQEPTCPVMIHFGGADDHIGQDQIDAVRNAHGKHEGEVEIFIYEGAQHAFANPDRPSFKADAEKLARERSLKFLKANIA